MGNGTIVAPPTNLFHTFEKNESESGMDGRMDAYLFHLDINARFDGVVIN